MKIGQEYNWIEIEDGKIVDLANGNQREGCACGGKTPMSCRGFKSCLEHAIKSLTKEELEQVVLLLVTK